IIPSPRRRVNQANHLIDAGGDNQPKPPRLGSFRLAAGESNPQFNWNTFGKAQKLASTEACPTITPWFVLPTID
nr:hypothetical protein [Anaerohalosphaeraceae bacterium]